MKRLVLLLMAAATVFAQAPAAAPKPVAVIPSYKQLTYPALKEVRPPEPVQVTLSNGMVAYLVPDHTTPLITVAVVMRMGAQLDPAGTKLYGKLVSNPSHVAAALRMMANWELEPLLKMLPNLKPLLVLVAAEGDRAIPPAVAVRVREIQPRAVIERLPGLGHGEVLDCLRLGGDGPGTGRDHVEAFRGELAAGVLLHVLGFRREADRERTLRVRRDRRQDVARGDEVEGQGLALFLHLAGRGRLDRVVRHRGGADEDVAVRDAGRTKVLGHRHGSVGHVARGNARIDLDELLVDVMRHLLRRRIRIAIDGDHLDAKALQGAATPARVVVVGGLEKHLGPPTIAEFLADQGKQVEDTEPDALVICDRQRNGEWEGRIKLWYHKPSMNYMGDRNYPPLPLNLGGVNG